MAAKKIDPLKGVETAPEFFVDGIADIQFLGVNTRYIMYRNRTDERGATYRQVVMTIVGPTGSLAKVLAQLVTFAIHHRLPTPHHDATR